MRSLFNKYRVFNPIFIFLITIFIFLSFSLLLEDPQIWPDEAIYGDIALNLLDHHKLGTDLLKGLIHGVEDHAYWSPPLFFYISATWFHFMGFSISSFRVLIIIFSLGFLFVFYKIAHIFFTSKTSADSYLTYGVMGMLIFDGLFLRMSRFGRQEMLVLLLSGIGLLSFIKTLEQRSTKQRNRLFSLSGLFLGLAATTHLIAISFFIPVVLTLIKKQRLSLFKQRFFYLFLMFFSMPLLIWLVSIFPNYNYLTEQLYLTSLSRTYVISWVTALTTTTYYVEWVNHAFYVTILFSFLLFVSKKRDDRYFLLSAILISTWIFGLLGKLYVYTVYFIPYTYLALFILIKNYSKNTFRRRALLFICLIILLGNLATFYSLYMFSIKGNLYQTFGEKVTKLIPPGKTVLLSSIPDGYFILNNGRNKMYEFPVFMTDVENYHKVLDDTDYIIYSTAFGPFVFADYLNKYIEKNSLRNYSVSNPYNVLIIQLKDKKDRIDIRKSK